MTNKAIRLWAEEFEGYGVTVTIDGGIDTYAKAFLHIFNNVRERHDLYYVENYHNNDVTVYCALDTKDALIEYLEQFGRIKRCEKVLLYQNQELPDRDLDTYYDQVIIPYTE